MTNELNEDLQMSDVSVEVSMLYTTKEEKISSLKKKIKHCKNHMERTKLEQELNSLYKKRKK